MRKAKALQELETALFEEMKAKHPTIPVHYLPAVRREDRTANGLTRCIIDHIRLNGGQAERISITGRPTATPHGVKWGQSHMTKGTADISATIHGQSVKIEVKIGTDRQSEAQKKYQQQITEAGGIYYIARNFTDFAEWYKEKWNTN